MPHRSAVVPAAALLIGIVAGCSSSPPPALQGTLPPGTAQMTVNNHTAATHAVSCRHVRSLTFIDTGDTSGGISAIVDSGSGLVVRSVNIRDVGAFTGGYHADLGGRAEVSMVANTYTIGGTAAGFDPGNPLSRMTGDFVVKVAC